MQVYRHTESRLPSGLVICYQDTLDMPKLSECLIRVDLALTLREVARAMHLKIPKGNLQFRCPDCKRR